MTNRVGVRTNCAEREERKEQRWETAKWLGLPGKNVLVEVYRSPDDPKEHKKTAHYQIWRDTVAEMMAKPRTSVKYDNIFPDDPGWG
jgi:quinol monooxygenase YgiN